MLLKRNVKKIVFSLFFNCTTIFTRNASFQCTIWPLIFFMIWNIIVNDKKIIYFKNTLFFSFQIFIIGQRSITLTYAIHNTIYYLYFPRHLIIITFSFQIKCHDKWHIVQSNEYFSFITSLLKFNCFTCFFIHYSNVIGQISSPNFFTLGSSVFTHFLSVSLLKKWRKYVVSFL